MPTEHAFPLRSRSGESHNLTSMTRLADVSTVGLMLQEMREQYGLTLRDVANALRIRVVYLHALEEGRLSDLPGRTYAVGFLRSYAEYFGLDGDEVVRRFREERKEGGKPGRLNFPEPPPDTKLPIGAMLAILVAVSVVGYGVWQFFDTDSSANRPMVASVPTELASETDRLDDEAAGLADLGDGDRGNLDGTMVATLSDQTVGPVRTRSMALDPNALADAKPGPTPAEQAWEESGPVFDISRASAASFHDMGAYAELAYDAPPTPAIPPSLLGFPNAGDSGVPDDLATYDPPLGVGVGNVTLSAIEAEATEVFGEVNTGARVVLRATDDCWIQITDAGGVEVFTRLLKAGDIYKVPDRPGLDLRMGNAGGLEFIVDGIALPLLGRLGEVKRNVSLNPEALLGTL